MGYSVLQVKATDSDVGNNGNVQYNFSDNQQVSVSVPLPFWASILYFLFTESQLPVCLPVLELSESEGWSSYWFKFGGIYKLLGFHSIHVYITIWLKKKSSKYHIFIHQPLRSIVQYTTMQCIEMWCSRRVNTRKAERKTKQKFII